MSAVATAPAPTLDASRAGRLLSLVRKLIDYGRGLVATLRQPSPATDLRAVTHPFGTADVALILARITRGLQRADALGDRLQRNAGRLDAPARPRTAPARLKPAARIRSTTPVDQRLAKLPTAEQIAADVRRRPIGTVIADICCDLGILPCHPLWRELSLLIIRHGGSLARLLNDILQRAFPCPDPAIARAARPAPPSSSPLPNGTGPP